MKLHAFVFVFISLVFFVIECVNVSSYSSKLLRFFKFIFSISLGLFLSFISIVCYDYDKAFNDFPEIYKLFIIFPCVYIVFIGIEMIIYGFIGRKEYR